MDFVRADWKRVRAKWELARANRKIAAQSEKQPRRVEIARAKPAPCPRKVNFRRAKRICLLHAQNLRRLFRSAEGKDWLVAGFFAHELLAERGLRGDDEYFLFVVHHFGAAGARADEVNGVFAAVLQFHERAEVDGFVRAKLFHGQLLKLGDGGFEFRRLLGLAAREIGGFEAARVVFALGLARLVSGLGAENCAARK